MRFIIIINFVLLTACLALSPGQDTLKSRGEAQVPSFLRARADAAPLNGSATSTDVPSKSNTGSHHPPPLLTVKDPKLCAIIVKRMKEFEATSKNGRLPPSKPGVTTLPSGTSSSLQPSASGVGRRSKLTQRVDIKLNRRESSGPEDASVSTPVDPNACKEMETMIKAAREKTHMKKGMPAPKPDGAKKESTPKTSPTDTKPTKSATDAEPKTESSDTTPKTSSTDDTPKTGSTDADS